MVGLKLIHVSEIGPWEQTYLMSIIVSRKVKIRLLEYMSYALWGLENYTILVAYHRVKSMSRFSVSN